MARTALNFFVAAAGHPFGHFYHTMYQKYQGSYSLNDAKLFQFLEVSLGEVVMTCIENFCLGVGAIQMLIFRLQHREAEMKAMSTS